MYLYRTFPRLLLMALTFFVHSPAHAEDWSVGYRGESSYSGRWAYATASHRFYGDYKSEASPTYSGDAFYLDITMILGAQVGFEVAYQNRPQWPISWRFATAVEQPLTHGEYGTAPLPQGYVQFDLMPRVPNSDEDVNFILGFRYRVAETRWDPVWDRYSVQHTESLPYLGAYLPGELKGVDFRIWARMGIGYRTIGWEGRVHNDFWPNTTLTVEVSP